MTAVALALDGLVVRRGGRTVIDRVSLALGGPGIVAVCGPNGAGKSSLLAALAGVLPHGGRAHWQGAGGPRPVRAYLPQVSAVSANLSVLEVALLGRVDSLRWTPAPADLDAAAAALEAVGMADLAERRIDALSGGQQQLALLAQRLVRRPRLLLLDEPTSALDLNRQLAVFAMLSAYARDAGAVVIAALHDLSLATRFASTMVLLSTGAPPRVGPPSEVLRPETIRAVYGVSAEILRTSAGTPVVAPLASLDSINSLAARGGAATR